jgi:hypothetical protein
MTEHRKINRLVTVLLRQRRHKFPARKLSVTAPTSQGVYIIRDAAGTVVHVGRTMRGSSGLRRRLKNHLYGQSSFVKKQLDGRGSLLRGGYTFQWLDVPVARTRVLVECGATARLCPAHLGDGAKR